MKRFKINIQTEVEIDFDENRIVEVVLKNN